MQTVRATDRSEPTDLSRLLARVRAGGSMSARYQVVGAIERSAAEQIEGAESVIGDGTILVDDGDELILIAQPTGGDDE